MDDVTALALSIERVVAGPVWHGPALSDLLADVPAADAAARPIEGAHSIWEIVNHIAAWVSIVESRLGGVPTPEPTDEDDWPPVQRSTAAAWAEARSSLASLHQSLAGAVRRVDAARLDQIVPGRNYTLSTMLHGVAEHGAYHGGQIALLTRAKQGRP